MKKIIIKYYCDICKQETNNKEIDIQVIFTTEQNEGRCCYHHLCNEKLNICDNCMKRILIDGNYIYASGAMGANNYVFKNKEVE